jgi:hypothetical protein
MTLRTLKVKPFKSLWADTAKVAVSAFSIVKHFDVIKDIILGEIACFIDAFLDALFGSPVVRAMG